MVYAKIVSASRVIVCVTHIILTLLIHVNPELMVKLKTFPLAYSNLACFINIKLFKAGSSDVKANHSTTLN